MRTPIAIVAVTVLVVLAGCGGGGSGGAGTTDGATTVDDPATTATTAETATTDSTATPTQTPTTTTTNGTDTDIERPAPFGERTGVDETVGDLTETGTFLGNSGKAPWAATVLSSDPARAVLFFQSAPALEDADLRASEPIDTARLRETARNVDEDDRPDHVVVTAETVGQDFPDVLNAVLANASNYVERKTISNGDGDVTVPTVNDAYRSTLLAGLYFEDGNRWNRYRLVRESSNYRLVGGFLFDGNRTETRASVPLQPDWTDQLANISQQLDAARSQDRGAVLREDTVVYDGHVESAVKVFERVPGARISGRVADGNNTTLTLGVEMRTDSGRTFQYLHTTVTGPDGRFGTVVPYATTGSDVDVVATGNYTLYAGVTAGEIRSPFLAPDLEGFAVGEFPVPESAVENGRTVDLGVVEREE